MCGLPVPAFRMRMQPLGFKLKCVSFRFGPKFSAWSLSVFAEQATLSCIGLRMSSRWSRREA